MFFATTRVVPFFSGNSKEDILRIWGTLESDCQILKLLLIREVYNSPLRFIFVWRDPLWSYGMKSGFAEKQVFKLRKIVFSAHAWITSNPHKINMWVDLGTWNIDFANNLKKTEALRKNNFSGSKNSFFPMPLVKSANSTSLPRLSSLQIVQMHAIHN